MNINAPWLSSYGDVPHSLDYPDCSMTQLVMETANKYPDIVAYDFFGCKQTYRAFAGEIRLCARGLKAAGIERDERVTICMPNTPQAVIMFYALNLIGAVANMVHPLSAEEELVHYINSSRSAAVLTLDQFAQKLEEILHRTPARILILAGADDGLTGIKKSLYRLTKGRKISRRPSGGNILRYSDLMERGKGYAEEYDAGTRGEDIAAILYSGGVSCLQT
jgi:long-chain acyl-CoA synthetase